MVFILDGKSHLASSHITWTYIITAIFWERRSASLLFFGLMLLLAQSFLFFLSLSIVVKHRKICISVIFTGHERRYALNDRYLEGWGSARFQHCHAVRGRHFWLRAPPTVEPDGSRALLAAFMIHDISRWDIDIYLMIFSKWNKLLDVDGASNRLFWHFDIGGRVCLMFDIIRLLKMPDGGLPFISSLFKGKVRGVTGVSLRARDGEECFSPGLAVTIMRSMLKMPSRCHRWFRREASLPRRPSSHAVTVRSCRVPPLLRVLSLLSESRATGRCALSLYQALLSYAIARFRMLLLSPPNKMPQLSQAAPAKPA